MGRRPLKTSNNEEKILHVFIAEDIHNKMVDICYKKNITIKSLVNESLIDTINKNL